MAAKKKEATDIIVSPTLFEIAAELKAVIDTIVENGGEVTEESMSSLQEWREKLEEKAEKVAVAKVILDSECAKFKAIEEAARSRRKSRESAIAGIKDYLCRAMVSTQTTRIKKNDGLFTISLSEGRSSVSIDDINLLPFELTEIVESVRPKLDEIKRRLEAGETVPGASLRTGEPYITIRGGIAKIEDSKENNNA